MIDRLGIVISTMDTILVKHRYPISQQGREYSKHKNLGLRTRCLCNHIGILLDKGQIYNFLASMYMVG